MPDIAESSAKGDGVDSDAKKSKIRKKELKVNVSLTNDDGIGSLPHTPTNCNSVQVRSDFFSESV